MIRFKIIAEIKYTNYEATSLDHYEDVKIESFMYIPGICISGKKELTIKFSSLDKQNVKINFTNKDFSDFESYLSSISLHHQNIRNRNLLDELGKFFNAKLYSKGADIYLYEIILPDGNTIIPSLHYFKHKIDNSQYLMLSGFMTPQERTDEQSGEYIDRLWQVELNHTEFMKLINE